MQRTEQTISGGCQCGAVRCGASAVMDNAHLCHCRMCQKAVGGLFAALRDALVWTRGEPARWRSSAKVDRGFCSQRGTPLFYEDVSGAHVSVTLGSLDDPRPFKPVTHDGIEGRMPWFFELASVRDFGETEQPSQADRAAAIKASNRQHPDHDTQAWP